jgi:hypothetical protein
MNVTEIVVQGVVVGTVGKAVATTLLSGPLGAVLVTVLGLALLGIFVRQVLFTPVEEAGPLPDLDSLREVPVPEQNRFGDSELLRSLRRHVL